MCGLFCAWTNHSFPRLVLNFFCSSYVFSFTFCFVVCHCLRCLFIYLLSRFLIFLLLLLFPDTFSSVYILSLPSPSSSSSSSSSSHFPTSSIVPLYYLICLYFVITFFAFFFYLIFFCYTLLLIYRLILVIKLLVIPFSSFIPSYDY
jgi:hypothetical protein